MSRVGVSLAEQIRGYHAHVYCTLETRALAERLREEINGCFPVQLGRWHDVPVGPHPTAMYQVAFKRPQFAALVPWLMLNRLGLHVLIHPLTGNDYEDHASHALWLGEALSLRLDVLRQTA